MQRCLHLAQQGLGKVAPNPMVGCVIVHNNTIIGEGFHEQYGEAHAEVNAINSVQNLSLLPDSTVFVNLEPCAHYGHTPPCCNLLIQHRVKRVIVACLDSNPLVAGEGVKKIQAAGIEVQSGIMQKEARELNKRFFTYHEKKRPYIILKWAQTQDGFLSKLPPFTKEENWITNEKSKKIVHTWRAQEQAILVGTRTALFDNPELTTRAAPGKNPIRIVIDKELKVPLTHNVFNQKADTFVFTEKNKKNERNITYFTIDFSKNAIDQILSVLYHKKISSLIVEGGTHTLQKFIEHNSWDEARVFTGNKWFENGILAPTLKATYSYTERIDDDTLEIFIR
ncbi:MAG: bifunctional diaminohydroxyphosphoribosylaminopyrimidine deaminase/5-amino-6-(5-phosphoribosylamino)uracil reductase RibD [Bacteroidetes bacterium]|nr:bifunctional diaminohydroxyphosphoribosylaminopyrimidine deaminase/5-amino-6-(5-phosphoribosylamino)uracil reductase RibD [Bacteroidota bacterium]